LVKNNFLGVITLLFGLSGAAVAADYVVPADYVAPAGKGFADDELRWTNLGKAYEFR
jgi:hypothetical protein